MMRSFSPLWSCDFWISHAEPWRKIPTDLHKWDTFPTQVLVLVLRRMCRQWAGLAWRCLWRWTENVWKMGIGQNRWNQNQIQPWFFWWGREVNQSTKQFESWFWAFESWNPLWYRPSPHCKSHLGCVLLGAICTTQSILAPNLLRPMAIAFSLQRLNETNSIILARCRNFWKIVMILMIFPVLQIDFNTSYILHFVTHVS